jgi:CheY-like chemotaxis protein
MSDIRSLLHNFNNLLTTILGNVELIGLAGEMDESVDAYLREIRHAAEKATLMIEEFRSSEGGASMSGIEFVLYGDGGEETTPSIREDGKKTILVVEDEASVRKMICGILRKQGYRVVEAEDVIDAMDIAIHGKRESVDLLLTDVVMPVMNGTELAEKVLSVRSSVKVMYISGYTGDSIRRHVRLREGINFLKKPFIPRDLTEMVRMIL